MIVKTKSKRVKLVKAREKEGLTQVEVANKAKISERYYQQVEAGTSSPTVDIAKLIAQALNSTVEELF